MINRSWLLMWILCLSSFGAGANPLRPNSGLWWEEPVTGRFYAVEIAPSGKTYVVISEFGADGKPTWKAMRGDLVVTSEAEQIAGAPLATLTAPLLELDGACPTCPPVSPNARPLGTATIVFSTHATAEYQENAIRRPLRYFAPADQAADFPANRLGGEYVLAYGSGPQLEVRGLTLYPANDAACGSYVGQTPAAGSVRLRPYCPSGLCPGGAAGTFAANAEIAVGAGEHPQIVVYERTQDPQATISAFCTNQFLLCGCPPGTSIPGSTTRCLDLNAPKICVESHRVSEQHGVIKGLALLPQRLSFRLYPKVP
jgi:hypothetical protein